MNGIFPPISLWGGPLDGAIIELTPLNKHAGYQAPHVDKLGIVDFIISEYGVCNIDTIYPDTYWDIVHTYYVAR